MLTMMNTVYTLLSYASIYMLYYCCTVHVVGDVTHCTECTAPVLHHEHADLNDMSTVYDDMSNDRALLLKSITAVHS